VLPATTLALTATAVSAQTPGLEIIVRLHQKPTSVDMPLARMEPRVEMTVETTIVSVCLVGQAKIVHKTPTSVKALLVLMVVLVKTDITSTHVYVRRVSLASTVKSKLTLKHVETTFVGMVVHVDMSVEFINVLVLLVTVVNIVK